MTATPSPLPPLYDRWMQACLGGAIPGEPKATCHDCAMCQPGGEARTANDPVFYDPRSKCCTYTPVLWNFLVGALLDDATPEAAAGRRTVEDRIAAGIGVTPLGLQRPPAYTTLYRHIREAFGRAQSMRCPHYLEDGGLCGVWRARESTCATWFCKHERGAVGKRFWHALHRLLLEVERTVGTWVLLELDVGTPALAAIHPFPPPDETLVTGDDFDGRVSPERRQRLWGRWAGREQAFYREAGKLARALSWERIREIGGTELQVAVEIARAAYAEILTPRLPERLQPGSFQLAPQADGGALVTSYSAVDPLRLSAPVLGILPYFDGRRSTGAAREAIQQESGRVVGLPLLQRLVDYGILVDADPASAETAPGSAPPG